MPKPIPKTVFQPKPKFANCFVCSPTNPAGLHIANTPVGDRQHMEFEALENMTGHGGFMHNGFAMMVLDDIMIYVVDALDLDSVTLHTECDVKRPARIGEKLVAESWLTKRDGKKLFVRGELRTEDGELIASADGLYYIVDIAAFLANGAE